MKKTLIITALLLSATLILAAPAFAFGGYGGGGEGAACLKEQLTAEQAAQFEAVIEQFRENMAILREKMEELRAHGDFEALRELRDERHELMQERREALSEILPADLIENFRDSCRGMRNNAREKGTGGFRNGQ